MANTKDESLRHASGLRTTRRGIGSKTTRQLEAYLQARDTLRRLRAASALSAHAGHRGVPTASKSCPP